ncbi:enoyl-CoA hydratase [Aspergillus avenaceus]|uniref:Enoyl-CoA hydratase n=1 Tax=Aspergillus avenaceus TaxID=36643 RepID=A0A5N6TNQ9_ASPAV|nr:enoyl-CoA hydratase [Aspergillus avenaceus]
MTASFKKPPPSLIYSVVSFPLPHILFVVFNRPKVLNCLCSDAQYELEELFAWYDTEPSLRCAVVTGAGRAFCTGADLKEWDQSNERKERGERDPRPLIPPSGFGGLSRRHGKKPVIAAVNGLAFGGGMEIVANLDLILAAKSAKFALPEAKRGVVAMAGSLPRLTRTIGRPRAMQMALTGRAVTADEAEKWGFVNIVVDDATSVELDVIDRPVVKKALEYATEIVQNSPDSVIISRAGVMSAWEDASAENSSRLLHETWGQALDEGENLREGVMAFVQKREPHWVNSKL